GPHAVSGRPTPSGRQVGTGAEPPRPAPPGPHRGSPRQVCGRRYQPPLGGAGPESGGGTYRHRVPRRFPGFAPTLTGRTARRAAQAGPAWVAGPTGGGWLPAGRHLTPDLWSGEEMMQDRPKVIAFDVDTDSLASLRQAFPEWEVEATNGATSDSLE